MLSFFFCVKVLYSKHCINSVFPFFPFLSLTVTTIMHRIIFRLILDPKKCLYSTDMIKYQIGTVI